MRCYFIRNKRIEAVYMLKPGPDEDLVRQAKELFEENAGPNMPWRCGLAAVLSVAPRP